MLASPPGENELLDQDKPLSQEKFLDQDMPLGQKKFIGQDKVMDQDKLLDQNKPLGQDKLLDKDKFLDQDKPLDQSPAPMRCLQPGTGARRAPQHILPMQLMKLQPFGASRGLSQLSAPRNPLSSSTPAQTSHPSGGSLAELSGCPFLSPCPSRSDFSVSLEYFYQAAKIFHQG